ncbi:MAG TPA: hypothetical protein VKR43_04920 [Bryobacteraceae bacterium]|nr:hypothetical protein [Bryobacteraceae bacterium]
MTRTLLFLAVSLSLFGQRRFSWQNACFNNLAAPYCAGHDFAIKPTKTQPGSKNGGLPNGPENGVAGGIDWRFADPSADAVVGLNISRIASSPVGRRFVIQLGVSRGLTEADMQKILDGLAGVDQVALSVHNNRMVAMIIGGGDSTLPALEADWTAAPAPGGSMLVGHTDAVDQALQRLSQDDSGPPSESIRLFEQQQNTREFWAAGSAGFAPEAAGAGAKRFSLALSIGNSLSSDVTLEFAAAPGPGSLQMWTALGKPAVEGNKLRFRTSVEPEEAQKFSQIAANPLAQRLAALISTSRYLPTRDTTLPNPDKPVIYGLEGGPKVVNQH